MKKSPKSMVGIQEHKGNAPRYYGDTTLSTGKQKSRGTSKQISVKMGKIPNKKAKSFE